MRRLSLSHPWLVVALAATTVLSTAASAQAQLLTNDANTARGSAARAAAHDRHDAPRGRLYRELPDGLGPRRVRALLDTEQRAAEQGAGQTYVSLRRRGRASARIPDAIP
jgi:hypothetical protein